VTLANKAREDWGIERPVHPPSSPDLNPIELVWAYLKMRLGMRLSPPRMRMELWVAIVKEYEAMPQKFIDYAIMLMYGHRQEVQESMGWHTSQ
jgi:hypothetical protein